MSYKQSLLDSPYNLEPVFYCKHCLSLRIRSVGEQDFCDECGSVDIAEASIFEWEKLKEERNLTNK